MAGGAAGLLGAILLLVFKAPLPDLRFNGWELAAMLLMIFPTLVLHEAGHVLFGMAQGFRFGFLRAGPISVQQKDQRISVRFHPNLNVWDAKAGCFPRAATPELRWQMFWFTAGGPALSLLGGAAVFPGLLLRNIHSGLAMPVLFFGLISLVLGLVVLIPAGSSDGARMLMLLRNQAAGLRWTAIGAVSGLTRTQRPRDWPSSLFEMMGETLDGSLDSLTVCTLRYLWHSDRSEWEAAALWLERGLERIELVQPPSRSPLYLCAASFEARHRRNAAAARSYFDLACQPGLLKGNDLHLLAARVFLVEARLEEARAELDLAAASLPTKTPVFAEMAREEIAELRAAIGDPVGQA